MAIMAKSCWARVLLFLNTGLMYSTCYSERATWAQNFVVKLNRKSYFDGSNAAASHLIRFIPSKKGEPDLPAWLRFVQKDLQQDAYLYGTPQTKQDSVSLEIVAINKNTQSTAYGTLDIEVVVPSSERATHVVELAIKNHNVEDMFVGPTLQNLKRKLTEVWPGLGALYVVKVTSPIEMGARAPVPESSGQPVPKEGVIVQVGRREYFSSKLMDVKKITRCVEGNNTGPQVGIDATFKPDFIMDWCKFKMINMTEPPPTLAPSVKPVVFLDDGLDLRTYMIGRRDFSDEFVICLVLPCVLGVVFFLILSYVLFFGREGVDKRDRLTPEQQLVQFSSIKRATTNLRYMSHRRSAPPPLRGSPATQPSSQVNTPRTPRLHPTPTPPPRSESDGGSQQAPPPYRLPPTYQTGTEASHI